ncbi:MAG: serine/threonine-protein kinase [Myxococcota bacterium]
MTIEPEGDAIAARLGSEASSPSGLWESHSPSSLELLTRYATSVGSASVEKRSDDPMVLTRMGRYLILRKLGEGGMGVVLAAYDEQLDRRVAIKVLFDERNDRSHRALRSRLVREAQALARLSHPNVVSVFEVGEDSGRVYMAMELVSGQSLRQQAHLARKEQGWRGVLELYRQAGQGLCAAHDAGLLHRDFKPQNAIVDEQGRVRVLDFGLARTFDTEDPTHPQSEHDPSTAGSQSRAQTRVNPTLTGMIAGTPPYMSPEQHTGEPLDARSDQFSFCVALYEGLYGQRPYRGHSVVQLATKAFQGIPDPLEQEVALPGWLRKVVLRGLSPHPDDRWPSMHTLLEQLERRDHRSRSWIALSGAVALTSVLTYAGVARSSTPCTSADERIEEVWNDEQRDRLWEVLGAAEHPGAAQTWSHVEATLDAYATRWTTMVTDSCVAHEQGERSDELYDQQVVCLDQRRHAIEQVIDVLHSDPASAAEHAVPMVMRLPILADCADIEALDARVEPPRDPADRAQVASLRRQLSRVRALEQSERFDEAEVLTQEVLAQARELDYPPLLAETLAWVGSLAEHQGHYKQADKALTDALWTALSCGHDETAVNAARMLIYLQAARYGDHERAAQWGRLAQSLITRSPIGPRVRAAYDSAMGSLAHERGDYEEAKARSESALQIYREIHPEDHPDTASVIGNIGHELEYLGDYEGALALYEEALRMKERLLGPDSEAVAYKLLGIGYLALSRQDFDDAERWLERSREAFDRLAGPRHPQMPYVEKGFARVAEGRGDGESVRRHLRQALDLTLAQHGEQHVLVTDLESQLADQDLLDGRFAEAKERLERVVHAYEGTAAPGYVYHAFAWLRIGRIERIAERHEAAEVAFARAREIALEAKTPIPELVTELEVRRAQLARMQGDRPRARELLDAAAQWAQRADPSLQPDLERGLAVEHAHLALLEGRPQQAIEHVAPWLEAGEHSGYPEDRAATRFLVAQAKEERDGMTAEVRALVDAAIDELREAHMPGQAQRLQAWIDERQAAGPASARATLRR